jgi:hypothetical protein
MLIEREELAAFKGGQTLVNNGLRPGYIFVFVDLSREFGDALVEQRPQSTENRRRRRAP